ncbi:hypothetical protein BC938DRAFT_471473 [Jimgerdemannia flammicorona]|uniref:AMP-dependent synthetase/ligase domain-containing protein n=1 Tax=Jimgerdemannia flammicorona TaxID=994334 RepID=A0A433Q822_9FUNG|nr:hypothetical protein BC938DRAFT_471473 [Jimgerdemannia flammicorona]
MLIDNYLGPEDVFIGYLPQAHVLEFLVENMLVFQGIPIGYGRVRTLLGGDSVVGTGGAGQGAGDLKLLRPSLMAGVPTVWERIRKGMLSKVTEKGWFTQTVFNGRWW